jgi:hypothetical protein
MVVARTLSAVTATTQPDRRADEIRTRIATPIVSTISSTVAGGARAGCQFADTRQRTGKPMTLT